MKNLFYRIALLVLAVLFSAALTGCNPEEGNFSVSFKEAGPGYVKLNVTVSKPTTISYVFSTEPKDVTDEDLAYTVNMGGAKELVSSDGVVTLYGDIKESQTYYLYLVPQLGSGIPEVYEFTFTTEGFHYSDLVTVVGSLYDGYKVHISVPESVKNSQPGTAGSRAIRYNHCCVMMSNYMRRYMRTDDYFSLLYNGQRHTTEDVTLEYSETLNREQVDMDVDEDGDIDADDLTIRWNPISPGEPVVFIAGEFEWMQEPADMDKDGPNYEVNGFDYPAGWEPGYYLPCIDHERYFAPELPEASAKSMGIIDDFVIAPETDEYWTGAFQRKIFRTRMPSVLDADIDVQWTNVTAVNATVIIEPDENVYQYCYSILDDGTYNEMLKLLDGNEEYLQWAVTSFFGMYNFNAKMADGVEEIELEDDFISVNANQKFHVLVTGMGDEAASSQCFIHKEFYTGDYTKKAGPEIKVTALEDETSEFFAAFNIKCTTVDDPSRGPVTKCYYGANYYQDWIYELNGNGTYETLGKSARFSTAEVAKINSEEGYDIYIPSIDGETTRLVVVGYNDENMMNDLNYETITRCPAVADCTTPYEVRDAVDSDLLNTDCLVGDWTLKALAKKDTTEIEVKSKISILRRFEEDKHYPSALPDEVLKIYQDVTKWPDAKVNEYFDEFKFRSVQYNEKRLEYQNKLLLTGWTGLNKYGALDYLSPWDLFKHEKINTVDVQQMFNDFGPKMFLEVEKSKVDPQKDSLFIKADMFCYPPVANWSDPFYLAGYADRKEQNTLFYDMYLDEDGVTRTKPLVFPVELVDDNTIKIKPIVDSENVSWYPNVIGISRTGTYILDNPVVSEVTLTRGWNEDSAAPARNLAGRRMGHGVSAAYEAPALSYKPMTSFESRKVNRVSYRILDIEEVKKNMERYADWYFNRRTNE